MELKGKIALITGGLSGIGAATASELARLGADIAIADKGAGEEKKVKDITSKIEIFGRKCFVVEGDLSIPDDASRIVDEVVEVFGGIDVLIHCAGGRVPGGLIELTPEAWYKAFDIHVHAVFHLCRAAGPHMQKRGEGAIVLISSAGGLRGCKGAIAYDVVKGAIPQFTRDLAREFADDNIRVNAVAPGIIRTPFQDYLTPEQVKNNIENRIPLHREGKPEDVAQLIALLATNEFITGEVVTIDGGMAMRIV